MPCHRPPRTALALGLLAALPLFAATTARADDSELADLKARLARLEAQQAAAPAASSIGTQFSYRGYIKTDALFSRFSDGEVASSNGLRDFYSPAAIPVSGAPASRVFDAHAKQSRFIFGSSTPAGDKAVKTHFEIDFMSAVDGNERVSNGYEPELRQAFVHYDRWLVGQAWSTFQDVAALPDSLDFVGPSDGTVFSRQPQLRYTQGGFSIALENSETAVTGFAGTCTTTPVNTCNTVSGDGRLPDLAMRQVWKGSAGHVSVAGLLRELATQDAAGRRHQETGAGLSVSGLWRLGAQSDLRFMLTGGSGIGRYVGLNLANDVAEDAAGALETIDVSAGFVALHHRFSPQWRSMASVSQFRAEHPAASGGSVTRDVQSLMANLVWTPVGKLDVGIELLSAVRETEAGERGRLERVQFSSKYSF